MNVISSQHDGQTCANVPLTGEAQSAVIIGVSSPMRARLQCLRFHSWLCAVREKHDCKMHIQRRISPSDGEPQRLEA